MDGYVVSRIHHDRKKWDPKDFFGDVGPRPINGRTKWGVILTILTSTRMILQAPSNSGKESFIEMALLKIKKILCGDKCILGGGRSKVSRGLWR